MNESAEFEFLLSADCIKLLTITAVILHLPLIFPFILPIASSRTLLSASSKSFCQSMHCQLAAVALPTVYTPR